MKNVFIFMILSPWCLSAQGFFIDTTDIPTILREYYSDMRKNQLYLDGAMSKHLGGIEFVTPQVMQSLVRPQLETIPVGLLRRRVYTGLFHYTYTEPYIYLQYKLCDNPQALRIVIYHELGHFYGLPHSDGIMAPALSTHQTYTESEWKELVKNYFDKIRALPPDSHWVRTDNTFY